MFEVGVRGEASAPTLSPLISSHRPVHFLQVNGKAEVKKSVAVLFRRSFFGGVRCVFPPLAPSRPPGQMTVVLGGVSPFSFSPRARDKAVCVCVCVCCRTSGGSRGQCRMVFPVAVVTCAWSSLPHNARGEDPRRMSGGRGGGAGGRETQHVLQSRIASPSPCSPHFFLPSPLFRPPLPPVPLSPNPNRPLPPSACTTQRLKHGAQRRPAARRL